MKPPLEQDLRVKLEEALPSPDPSEAAMRRVRRGIATKVEMERRFRTRAGWFVAAVVSAAVVTVMARARTPGSPANGSAAHHDAPSVTTPNDRVASEPSLFTLHHGARVLARPGTQIRVERDDDDGTAIELSNGVVFVSVEKRAQTSLTVRCAETVVEVMGTVFGVEAIGGSITRVSVTEGAVAVRRPDGLWFVKLGETWPAGAENLRPDQAERTRLASTQAEATPLETTEIEAPAAPKIAEKPAPRQAQNRRTAKPDVVSDPRWQAARKAELRGEWQQASSLYRELVASGQLAEDALFALGRVEQRQGDGEKALEIFRRYRTVYPDGAYARAADLHVLELLVSSGEEETALEEASRFLRRFPNDARAWKFRQTKSSLLAERGDCAGALAELKELTPSEATRAVEKRCSPNRR